MQISCTCILNATNIFKVPEVPKKVVPVKKAPVVKKPEPPAVEGTLIISDVIFLKPILTVDTKKCLPTYDSQGQNCLHLFPLILMLLH